MNIKERKIESLIVTKVALAAKYERLAALTSSGKFKNPQRTKFEAKAKKYRDQVKIEQVDIPKELS